AKFWRDVLTRIIKIILFLTAGNTALRGNEGKGEKASEGNFLRTVRLLAEFDPVLSTLLTVEENKVKYLSWSVQNEVIDLFATNVQNIICQEIREAPCFALIIDSTQDICKVDQFGIDINKCCGQGFDGASVMSGIHNGVKKRILDIVPNATYIHCNAHNLNLVLSDVARTKNKSGPRWASLTFGDNVANIMKKKVLKK
ncbi:zinc finger MYM-type protein 1-like, partial [Myzus persicae]|uniref:zinc finger MYM-type protein 1-like n=1 Tax=Myzus persicae TaxID=13164 RepID=UPI000B9300B2